MKKKGVIEKFSKNDFQDKNFVKDLPFSCLPSLASWIRGQILETVCEKGGHLSSNLGSVEICIGIFRCFQPPIDEVIFDVGHQCYPYKILSGRDLEFLFEKDGISGFQRRKESLFDCYDAGHSSTSLSAAMAYAYARDLKKENHEIIVVIGDASIVNGMAFEGLNAIGWSQKKVIVILNDNGMSIAPSAGLTRNLFRSISSGKVYNHFKRSFRKTLGQGKAGKKVYDFAFQVKNALKKRLISLNVFENLGFSYIGPVDGNDVGEVIKALEKAKRTTMPTLVHCKTKKGKGFAPAEEDQKGFWHSPASYVAEDQSWNPERPRDDWSSFYAYLLDQRLSEDPGSFLISPSTTIGSRIDEVFEKHPSQCLDFGIAEEHATTFCGALSLKGFRPILSIYSTFLQRSYDQLSHDCARMGANLTLMVEHSGLVGRDGETHQGIYDECYLKSIPGAFLSMAANGEEARYLFEESGKSHGVFGIRVPMETFKDEMCVSQGIPIEFGEFHPLILSSNSKTLFLCVGPKAEEMGRLVLRNGANADVFSALFLTRYGTKSLERLLSYESVVLYDAYGTREGFCESILADLMQKRYRGKTFVYCPPSAFIPFSPSKDIQETELGLDSETVFRDALRKIQEGKANG